MADRVGTNEALRDQIVQGYLTMGCPLDDAQRIADAAFRVHNDIEAERSRIMTGIKDWFVGPRADVNFDLSFLTLVVQLELLHLQQVYISLREQMGPTVPHGETVQ